VCFVLAAFEGEKVTAAWPREKKKKPHGGPGGGGGGGGRGKKGEAILCFGGGGLAYRKLSKPAGELSPLMS